MEDELTRKDGGIPLNILISPPQAAFTARILAASNVCILRALDTMYSGLRIWFGG